jgi:transposase
MSAKISIPLDIPDVPGLNVKTNRAGDYIITVESTLKYAYCRTCGRKIPKFHGHDDWITLRHLPILGHQVYIRLRPKRYQCPDCSDKPTSTQHLSWREASSPNTKAYEEHILLQLVNSTIQDVSRKERLGCDSVLGIVDRHIAHQVNWKQFRCLAVLGLDEIALKKGHRDYVTIVSARLAGGRVTVLAVLPDREKATVKEFLCSIPQHLRQTINTVCTDLYAGYIHAVKEVLPAANVVADRYHVAKAYRDGADTLRRQELKRLKKELPEEEYDTLKGALWPFRKKPAKLTQEEQELLDRVFAYSPALKQAYTFREELTDIFEQDLSKAQATREIKAWQKRVDDSELTCFDPFLATLDRHLDEITNYFLDRHSSGFVEGLNNKIKVLKRRCFGILNLEHLFQRLFLDLEGYRLFT